MYHKILKWISALLVLTLLFNMLPVQALESLSEETSAVETITETAANIEGGNIIAELPDNRDTYTKQFLLDNGNKMAVQYALPVHYQDSNGDWQQYDNRMTEIDADVVETAADITEAQYRVIQSDKDIRLAKKGSEKNLVTIEKDGHQISWGFSGINKVDAAFVEEDTSYEGNEAYLTLEGIIQEARYDNAFANVDLQYFVLPIGVKENIILKNADAQNEFEMEYKFHKLTATQTDSQHITLSDQEGNPVYTITAPTMSDANGVWSNALTLTIVEAKQNKLTVKLTVDAQWLQAEERSFPVTVDPSFQTDRSWAVLHSTTIVSGHPDTAYGPNSGNYIGSLYVGHETTSAFGQTRSLLRMDSLPALSPGDVIVDAQLTLLQQATYRKVQVNVHQATAPWNMTTATWNSMNSNYNPIVEDYDITVYNTINPSKKYYNSWNLTDLVRKWYDGTEENHGVMLISPAETATSLSRAIYYASTYPNNVTVRPVFTITFRNHNGLESAWDYTASSAGRAGTGYVNSYTGNLVWTKPDMSFGGNRAVVSIEHIYNANDAQENLFGIGYGWRTTYNQRVYRWTQDTSYYIWEDADGTDHYFKKDEDSSGVYKDEDGLELTLTTTGSGTQKFVIENKNGEKTYFDTNGRLTQISNNQQTVTNVTIAYTSADSLQIATVTDGVGRVYAFTYNADGLLSRLSFQGSDATERKYITYGYTNGNLTAVTNQDGKAATYTYRQDSHFLTEAKDIDDYKIVYQYTHFTEGYPSRITKVQEFDGEVAGGELTISYGRNETTFTDKWGTTQILQFNNWGNTVSVQDSEGRAQFGTYAQDEDSSAKGNQLTLSSKLQNTVRNLFADNSFEDGTTWTGSSSTATVSSGQAYFGSKALSISSTEQSTLSAGTYTVAAGKSVTFSGWVKTVSGTAKLGLTVGGVTEYSPALSGAAEWTRLQVSYTNKTEQAVTVQPVFCGAGEAYLDAVQLEYTPTASRYNLINNSDFQFDGQWVATNAETSDGKTTVAVSVPNLDSTAYKITGNATLEKNICQTINVSGAEGDSFVLGGWAMGDAVPAGSDRAFGIYAIFHYTDGTTSEKRWANFNPDVGGWQYAATGLAAEKDYTSMDVYVCYDRGANEVFFDGIQLYKEEFGTSYTYDPETGDVISVIDLQKKETTYEYDTDGNLTQILQDNKAKMTYEYDDYHNVTKATTEQGYVYTFTYDGYGNNTSVSITGGSGTITSSAAYTTDGNQIVSSTDALGKVTTYGYNTQTGILEWVQYPEDTADTRTEYTYDSMFRMATAAADLYQGTADTGKDLSVIYTYNDRDLLGSIVTPTTTYSFEYGNFGLRTKVTIGGNTLVSYAYNARNQLTQQTYGNGDFVQFEYDDIGRVTKQTYEDGATVTYAYDNIGNLATVTDSATGIVTTYYYDLLNRQVGYWEKSETLDHRVIYAYNEKNNLSSVTETVNGTTKIYSYTYDADNRLISENADGITVTYTYDDLGRLTQKQTKNGENPILTHSYYFNTTSDGKTSMQIWGNTIDTPLGGYQVSYYYDDNGNITHAFDQETVDANYVYDSQGQLIRENNWLLDFTYVWTYDNAGNILSRTEYDYTSGSLDGITPTDTVVYGYTDDTWGDLLTSYDGNTITYDNIGNPTNDEIWSYTWQHGRELASMSKGNTTWTYTYDANGMRTKRTNGQETYTYVYNGSQLVRLIVDGQEYYDFTITYDASGIPLTIAENGYTYYYITNLQGDVIEIKDSAEQTVVSYVYDAWGNILYQTNTQLADFNPLRYRGYVYDEETELYYLQSRYYNPEWGRFINGDGLVTTGQGFIGNNMFAYCGNNPVNFCDHSGFCSTFLWGLIHIDCKSAFCPTSKNYVTPKSIEPAGTYNKGKGVVYIVKPEQRDDMVANAESNVVIVVDNRVNSNDEKYNQNFEVHNSYLITSKEQQKEIIALICEYNKANPVSPAWDRTQQSMLLEWDVHNAAFIFYSTLNEKGIYTEKIQSAQHVNFDNNEAEMYTFRWGN